MAKTTAEISAAIKSTFGDTAKAAAQMGTWRSSTDRNAVVKELQDRLGLTPEEANSYYGTVVKPGQSTAVPPVTPPSTTGGSLGAALSKVSQTIAAQTPPVTAPTKTAAQIQGEAMAASRSSDAAAAKAVAKPAAAPPVTPPAPSTPKPSSIGITSGGYGAAMAKIAAPPVTPPSSGGLGKSAATTPSSLTSSNPLDSKYDLSPKSISDLSPSNNKVLDVLSKDKTTPPPVTKTQPGPTVPTPFPTDRQKPPDLSPLDKTPFAPKNFPTAPIPKVPNFPTAPNDPKTPNFPASPIPKTPNIPPTINPKNLPIPKLPDTPTIDPKLFKTPEGYPTPTPVDNTPLTPTTLKFPTGNTNPTNVPDSPTSPASNSNVSINTQKLLDEAQKNPLTGTTPPVTMPSSAPAHTQFGGNLDTSVLSKQTTINAPTGKAESTVTPFTQVATGAAGPAHTTFTPRQQQVGPPVILPGTREWKALQGAQAGATPEQLAAQTQENAQLQQLSGQSSSGAALPDEFSQNKSTGKTQYDLLRERIQGEEARNQQMSEEQLKQALASKGLGAGTGFGEKALMKAQAEAARTQAGRMGQIDVAEAAAKEAQAETEKQRTFQSQQAELDRSLTRDLEQGKITMQEKELALNASQFTSKQEFDAYALKEGFTEDEIARAWDASEKSVTRQFQQQERVGAEQFKASSDQLDRQLTAALEQGKINQADKELAMNAAQFKSKQEFDAWATKEGYSEADRERAFAAAQTANNQAYQTGERLSQQKFSTAMNAMENDFATGRMNLADQIDDTNKMQTQMMDSAYQKGLSMTRGKVDKGLRSERDETDVEFKNRVLKEEANMSDFEKAAYRTGTSGRSYENYTALRDANIAQRNASITKLDPKDAKFDSDLSAIMSEFNKFFE